MAVHVSMPNPWGRPLLQLGAIALLAIPAGVLTLFGVGEMLSGEPSGVQHLPEAVALILLAAFAWWRPRMAGIVLVAASVVLFAFWLAWLFSSRLDDDDDIPAVVWLATAAILFLPPFLAGLMLLRSTARSASE